VLEHIVDIFLTTLGFAASYLDADIYNIKWYFKDVENINMSKGIIGLLVINTFIQVN